jgi:predicted enzyme related to lactoylglutathione lyase
MNKYLLGTLFVLALLSTGIVTSAAPAPAIELPPLTQPASGETHSGKVIWADLVTPDLQQAENFYAGLFGWTFTPAAGDTKFAVASLEGRPVAGLLQRAPGSEKRQPAWLTFLAVRDVAAAQRSVKANGGKVLEAPRDFPQRGRQAVFADPDGAVFAVLASSSGDPPDFMPEPGDWIWSSVLVKNADRETGFYRALFGYEVFDQPADDMSRHVILASDDYARAGIHTLPDNQHRHPHWLNFVRVADVGAAVGKAVQLGGRILVDPRPDRQGGQLAVVADPSGAPIGLMEWPDADEQSDASGAVAPGTPPSPGETPAPGAAPAPGSPPAGSR